MIGLSILRACMPYFDGSQDKNEGFLTCIDAMQVIIDEYDEVVPIKFLGDFTAQLPRSEVTSNNWYKSKGFNVHSRLMRDFIVGNEISIVDLCFTRRPLIHILIFLATYEHGLIMYLVIIMMSVILIAVILSR